MMVSSGQSGSGSQPDHEQPLRDLHHWIKSNTLPSYDITTGRSDPQSGFVPISKVEDYFRDQNFKRTRNLLKAVFSTHEQPPATAKDVAETCSRVFCILSVLGKAKYIDSFTAEPEWLSDSRLPFDISSKPTVFPTSTSTPTFFTDFCREQWRFCAPILSHRSRRRFDRQYILPFRNLEPTGGGGSARVYKVWVHEDYDQLTQDHTHNHCYALKTFKKSNRGDQNYERELRAFKQVTESGTRSAPDIIGFYGSFEYRDTFNILMEFADGGTLEDYFQRQDSPSTGQQIVDFWESLLRTVPALFRIHEHHLNPHENEEGAISHGWHQDLKPENILVVTGGSQYPYKWRFKIADLNLSHFKTIMAGEPEATDQDTFGTRTYGAPECYSWTKDTENRKNKVKRSIDIWSLGAIYSEAAVWVVKGRSGVMEYRSRRTQETDAIPKFRGGDCFHDGEKRLPTVDKQHRDLRPEFKHEDWVTGKVIDTMIEEMLDADPEVRPSAFQLDRRVERCISAAKEELIHPIDDLNKPPPAPKRQPRWPPLNPYPGSSVLHGGYVESPRSTYIDPDDYVQQQGPPLSIRTTSSHHAPESFHHARNTSQYTIMEEDDGANSSSPPQVQSPRQSPPTQPRVPRTYRNSNHYSGAQSPAHAHPNATTTWGRQSSDMAGPSSSVHQASDPPSLEANSRIRSDTVTSHPQATPKKSKVPHCSVAQAAAWHKAKKYKATRDTAELPDHGLLKQLEGRDHVFMVDDSITMHDHWKLLSSLASDLAYITKRLDDDGLDLFFLSENSKKPHKIGSSTDMVTALRAKKPTGVTSLNGRFDRELRRYSEKIDQWKRGPKRNWKGDNIEPPKPMSVYVLTDGVLRADNDQQGHECIKLLSEKLVANDFPRGQFGVQFIRFGNDPLGQRRLEVLDRLNKELGLGLDLVDTEACDQNVWKMLLGAINALFDNDDEEDVLSNPVSPTSPARQ